MSGKLIIVSGPSGSGKTTVVHHLIDHFTELAFSVSATTRKVRGKEQEGSDYYFLKPNDFRDKIQAGEFLECEEVYHGLYYGTLRTELERLWGQNQIPVLDIDVKGAVNIKKHFEGSTLSIFIHPGSMENLEARLKNRHTENNEGIKTRLKRAEQEIKFAEEFDEVLMNEDLNETFSLAKTHAKFFINS